MDQQIRKRPIGEPLAETMRIWREANPHVRLSDERMAALQLDHARNSVAWNGSTVHNFATPEDEARHLEQVVQAQKDGAPF